MKHFVGTLSRWAAAIAAAFVISLSFGIHNAAAVDLFGDACKGAGSNSAACTKGTDIVGGDGIIMRAARLMAVIGGITAVIMVMVGGFMMITAGGDSGKLSTGRKTITYAVVGLIIISLSWAIVAFVATNV